MTPLNPNILMATAVSSYIARTLRTTRFDDRSNPVIPIFRLGQDTAFGMGRAAPDGQSVATTVPALKTRMRRLLGIFAANDTDGKARTLMNSFLGHHRTLMFHSQTRLDAAVNAHANVDYFCEAALGAPGRRAAAPGVVRIHQRLEQAGWNIQRTVPATGLGPPALNLGNKVLGTGDFGNGLGLMVNDIARVYVIATHYDHYPSQNRYEIRLKYVFFDVFGLDDDDLAEYGASSDWNVSNAKIGITAWWQLQHQHGFAPLITRMTAERQFEVSTT